MSAPPYPTPDPGREVLDRLVRIETKLDTALVNVADHENRLRALEQEAMTEVRVAAIAKKQAAENQTHLRGWLTLIVAALGILTTASVALFIAVFL